MSYKHIALNLNIHAKYWHENIPVCACNFRDKIMGVLMIVIIIRFASVDLKT